MMAHIINKAGIKQRSVIVTLLDLRIAFGDVNHNLTIKPMGLSSNPCSFLRPRVESLY